ncbi:Cytochrome c554 and c-prime [Chitinophaga sp. CF118]|uniref:multiheme c-type cytochrome n=1 Tax=Chitinophaga sp. CF118 TaxID=1884367 RepID=UPI0008E4CA2F|nr:multiheme c-type cytochrome [Chitinophaga sp. CF118]SFF00655.1 Cytochrome c554 and c-prime [Chitinophaga sp. CF118]
MRVLVFLIIVVIIIVGSVMCSSLNNSTSGKIAENPAFAGSTSCQSCHKNIFDSSRHTAHYFTSRPASEAFIKGSFEPGKNEFIYNKWMEVLLEKRKDGFWQTAYVNGIPTEQRAFGVVIGSGRKGQTYLYWEQNKLFQLPVSYYTPNNDWCNSPGYPVNYVKFNRPIEGACIECHSTYASTTVKPEGTIFNKKKIIYGVDCERCHGAAAAHVAFHTKHPEEKTAQNIIGIKNLSRQQRLDACALCHSGMRKAIKPAFSFIVGEPLNDYSSPNFKADSLDALDVHGNQYGLLTASKCFKMTEKMDCASCHDVHVNEVNSPQIFSPRCISCHNENGMAHNTCTFKPTNGLVLSKNCIDCHMPLLESKKITLKLANADNVTPDLVRTHRIAIYREQTKAFLDKIK